MNTIEEMKAEVARLQKLIRDQSKYRDGEIWLDDEGDLVVIGSKYDGDEVIYRLSEEQARLCKLVRKVGEL